MGFILSTAGLSITDIRYWCLLLILIILDSIAQDRGRAQGVTRILDMKLDDLLTYKARWDHAAGRDD